MKRSLLLLSCCAVLLAGCASNPAEDPVQIKLTDLDTRLGGVERVVSNQSLVDMSRRIDALEAQLRELRGGVEMLQNGSDTTRKSQRDLYGDLDKRLSLLEANAHAMQGAGGGAADLGASAGGTPGAMTGSAAAGPAGGSAGGASDDQAAYNAAFEKLKAGSYGDAIAGFKDMMNRYPSSTLLDNAQYWIGEAYYVTRDYDQAASAFRAVGERWPASRKAPDALLKLGYTQFEQKHLAAARATLQQVIARFADTDAARLAQERLRKLPPDGH
jgi:tol-pal system protein YbgF